MTMHIDVATERDLSDVRHLLESQRLTLEGVDEHMPTMVVARKGRRVVGTATLELHPDGALLRSLAVDTAHQGRGLGKALTEAALQLAQSHGVRDVFLLTISAEQYFPRFGFETIEREAVPASVQRSVQFRYACPASSVVMRKQLVPV